MPRNYVPLMALAPALLFISSARAERLAGVVLDAGGAPVAGARVLSPDTTPSTQATSGADGKFGLENLAPGFVVVAAIHPEKGAVSSRPISNGSDISLKLAPFSPPFTQDRARAEKILAELSQWSLSAQHFGRDYLWEVLVPYDLERAVELSKNPDGTLPDSFVFVTISTLGRLDPAKAVEWGVPRLNEIKDEDYRAMAISTLSGAIAEINPQLANELYECAAAMRPEGEENFGGESRMGLAIKLKRPEAKALINRQLEQARQEDAEGDEEEDEKFRNDRSAEAGLIGTIAALDLVEAERLLPGLDETKRADAQARIIAVLTRRGGAEDVSKARQLLEEIAAGKSPQASKYFALAARDVIHAIGNTDSSAALVLARRVAAKDSKPEALAAAARFQNESLMGVLLREAADAALQHSSPLGQLSNIALLAGPKFPDLARELALRAQRLWDGASADERDGFWRDYSARSFAVALRENDPLAARAFLEMEWARVFPAAAKSRKVEYLVGIASEMAELDFERALQMARLIPEGEMGFVFARYRAEHGLARRLLVGPEKWNSSLGYSWNHKLQTAKGG